MSALGGRLEGKVALVTGGGSGIGRASALTFLREGARVAVGDVNEASLAETVALARAQGAAERVASLRVDVSAERDVAALVALAVERFGGLDCVFNNAGVGGAFGPIGETTVEEWDFTFAVLVRGVFLGIKHGAARMKAQGRGGSIINTASIAGIGGCAGPHAYSAAKAAVANLSRSVSAELPEHIADTALFLASDESRFITGQVIVVDGGLTALGPDLFGHEPGSRLLRKAGLNTGS